MRKYLLLVFLLIITTTLFPQQRVIPKKINRPDCDSLFNIRISDNLIFGLINPPSGYGNKMEVHSKNKLDKYYFEEEHNSTWYKLIINIAGELIFEIIPEDPNDDYDFMLFKYNDSSDFCQGIRSQKIRPIRTNISRNNLKYNGRTGLAIDAKDEFVHQGVGNSFSKSIKVQPKEQYLLIIDKVKNEGKGYSLKFSFPILTEISGTVKDENEIPVKSEISLNDNTGNEIIKTETDDYGNYGFHTFLNKNQDYNLVFYSDSSFVETKTINVNPKNYSDTLKLDNIKAILPKLKAGKRYQYKNINFYGGLAILLPESYPSVEALYKLMKKNKKMIIRIEGHVNDPYKLEPEYQMKQLSEERALTVYNYLANKGIEKERMSFIGLSSDFPLFQRPKNESEMSANRRVEINVVSIK